MDAQGIRDAEENEEIIRKSLAYISKKTSNYHDLVIELQQRALISNSERQNIGSRLHDDATRFTELFTTVCRRSDWLSPLCESLRNTGNGHVADELISNSNFLRNQAQGSSTTCSTRQLSRRKESNVLVDRLRKIDHSIGEVNVTMNSFQTQFNTAMAAQEKMEIERNKVFFELANVIRKLGDTKYTEKPDENLSAQKENLGFRYRNINSDLDKKKSTVEKLTKKLTKYKQSIRELMEKKEELEVKILANLKDYREEKKRIMESNELLILELIMDLSVMQTDKEKLESEIQTLKSSHANTEALEAENSFSVILISQLEDKLRESKELIAVLKTQIQVKKRKKDMDEVEFLVFTVKLNDSPSPMVSTIDNMLMVTAEDILDYVDVPIYEQTSKITKFVNFTGKLQPRECFTLSGPVTVDEYTELPTDNIRSIEWTNCEVDSKVFLSILEQYSTTLELVHLDQIKFHGKLGRRIKFPNLKAVCLNIEESNKIFDSGNSLEFESLLFFYRKEETENIFETKVSFDLILNGRRVFKVDWNSREIVRCTDSKAFLGYGTVSAAFGLKELTLYKATNFCFYNNSSNTSLMTITHLNLLQVRLSREHASVILEKLPGLTALRLHLAQCIFLSINSIPSNHLKTLDLCNISLLYSKNVSFKNLENLRIDVSGMDKHCCNEFPSIFPSAETIELFDLSPNSLENTMSILQKIEKMKRTNCVIIYSVDLDLLRNDSSLTSFKLPENNLDVGHGHVKFTKDLTGKYTHEVTVSEDARDDSLLDTHGFDKSFISSALEQLKFNNLPHSPVLHRAVALKEILERISVPVQPINPASTKSEVEVKHVDRLVVLHETRCREIHEIRLAESAAAQRPTYFEILIKHGQFFDRIAANIERQRRENEIQLAKVEAQRPTQAEIQNMHQKVLNYIAVYKYYEAELRHAGRQEEFALVMHKAFGDKFQKLQKTLAIKPPQKLRSQFLDLDQRLWRCHICKEINMSNKLRCSVGCSSNRRSPSGHVDLDFSSKRARHYGQPFAFSLTPTASSSGGLTLSEGPSFPSSGELEMGQWACEACTFVNTVYNEECEMCQARRDLELATDFVG